MVTDLAALPFVDRTESLFSVPHVRSVDGYLDKEPYLANLPQTAEEYKERYRKSFELLMTLKRRGVAGAVYTQTTDVEGEVNGLMTYDREVQKLSAEELSEIHAPL